MIARSSSENGDGDRGFCEPRPPGPRHCGHSPPFASRNDTRAVARERRRHRLVDRAVLSVAFDRQASRPRTLADAAGRYRSGAVVTRARPTQARSTGGLSPLEGCGGGVDGGFGEREGDFHAEAAAVRV
jgi:hypothetical protein